MPAISAKQRWTILWYTDSRPIHHWQPVATYRRTCQPTLSADMSTNMSTEYRPVCRLTCQPTYRSILGRHNGHRCRPTEVFITHDPLTQKNKERKKQYYHKSKKKTWTRLFKSWLMLIPDLKFTKEFISLLPNAVQCWYLAKQYITQSQSWKTYISKRNFHQKVKNMKPKFMLILD